MGMTQETAEMFGVPKPDATQLEQKQSAKSLFGGQSMSQQVQRAMDVQMRGEQFSGALEENRHAPQQDVVETTVKTTSRGPGPDLTYG